MWITYSIKKIPIFKCFFMYKKYLYFIYPQVINNLTIDAQPLTHFINISVDKVTISS